MSKADRDIARHKAASHAMQSGVAMEMERDPKPTSPKHLRVGVNVALCDHAALVRLLMEKGLITEEEYLSAIADQMEQERARYEVMLTELLNAKITLA